jgi:hypothetical protein
MEVVSVMDGALMVSFRIHRVLPQSCWVVENIMCTTHTKYCELDDVRDSLGHLMNISSCWHDDDAELPSPLPGSCPPERVIPNNTSTRPDQARPGDKDPAGTNLRVTVSDLPTVTSLPAATDLDGTTSLYFGSAILPGEILPGKVVQMRTCQVLHNDAVVERNVGFSILPFSVEMELVPTSRGVIPQGRRPVQGNYDVQGRKLYHAMLYAVGRQFPGMCAEHLVSASLITWCLSNRIRNRLLVIQGGAQGVLQGKKYTLETGYTILWVFRFKVQFSDPLVIGVGKSTQAQARRPLQTR